MVASYSELYEEGEVNHINGPTHPPGEDGVRLCEEGDKKKKKKRKKELIKRPTTGRRKWVLYSKLTTPMGVVSTLSLKAVKISCLEQEIRPNTVDMIDFTFFIQF